MKKRRRKQTQHSTKFELKWVFADGSAKGHSENIITPYCRKRQHKPHKKRRKREKQGAE